MDKETQNIESPSSFSTPVNLDKKPSVFCTNHPSQVANEYCAFCGKSFCPECMVTVGTQRVCQAHAEESFRQQSEFQSAPISTGTGEATPSLNRIPVAPPNQYHPNPNPTEGTQPPIPPINPFVCTNHPNRMATGTCSSCGKVFCSDCLVNANGRILCKEEANQLYYHNNAGQNNLGQPNNSPYAFQGGYVPTYQPYNPVSVKNKWTAFILCFFFGFLGAHYFYAGKIGMGILYFFTFGFFGVGVVVDCIRILINSFRDSYGLPISK